MTIGSGGVTPIPHVVYAQEQTTISLAHYQDLMSLYSDLMSLYMSALEQQVRLQTAIRDAIAVLSTRQEMGHDLYTPETLLLDELKEVVREKNE